MDIRTCFRKWRRFFFKLFNRRSTTNIMTLAATPQPLLTYAIATDPFPLQASYDAPNVYPNIALLTLEVTNNSGALVNMRGLIVSIPVGTDAASLTPDASGIGPVTPPGWNLHTTRVAGASTEFIFYPNQPVYSFPNKTAITFYFNNVSINCAHGTVEIDITEGSDNCSPAQNNCPVQKLFVTKFPNGWGQVSFWVNPPDIISGEPVVFNWAGPAQATYTIDYETVLDGPVHIPNLAPQGQYPAVTAPPLLLTDTTAVTLSVNATFVSGVSYSAQLQKTVSVTIRPPKILHFSGVVQTNANGGIQLVLTWEADNDYCMISGDTKLYGNKSPEGGYIITPSPTNPLLSQYTLTAQNDLGHTSSTLTVVWGKGQTVSVEATTSVVMSNDGSILYLTGPGGITMIDTATMQQAGAPFPINSDFMLGPSVLSRDGSYLFAASPTNLYQLQVNGTSLQLLGSTSTTATPRSLVMSTDNNTLYLGSEDGSIRTYDIALNLNTVVTFGGGITLTPTADGKALYMITDVIPSPGAASTGSIVSIDAHTLAPLISQVGLSGGAMTVAVTADGSRIFAQVSLDNRNEQTTFVFKPGNTSVQLPLLGKLGLAGQLSLGLGVSLDGSFVYILTLDSSHNANLTMYNTATLEIAGSTISLGPTPFTPLLGMNLLVSPDASKIYACAPYGTVLWSVVPQSLSGGVL